VVSHRCPLLPLQWNLNYNEKLVRDFIETRKKERKKLTWGINDDNVVWARIRHEVACFC
jgi:hypothetical protein